MRLGVTSWVWVDHPLETALEHAHRTGIGWIEIGTGGYFPTTHCDPERLLGDGHALDEFRRLLDRYEMQISALAIHGEPLHPDPAISGPYDQQLRRTIALAKKLGVDRLTLLSGLPGASPEDPNPNWILYPYPPRNLQQLEWQWTERLIPYWRERARLVEDAGAKLCFEIHPADMVFQPSRLLRLRSEVGSVVGANLDPSHLIWQGMDVGEVILLLGDVIYNVHAKDTRANPHVVRTDGILDPKAFNLDRERAWNFRTIGYGNDDRWWTTFVSNLRMVGYEGVLAIEHEDPLFDPLEGFEKAAAFLAPLLPTKPRGRLWYE